MCCILIRGPEETEKMCVRCERSRSFQNKSPLKIYIYHSSVAPPLPQVFEGAGWSRLQATRGGVMLGDFSEDSSALFRNATKGTKAVSCLLQTMKAVPESTSGLPGGAPTPSCFFLCHSSKMRRCEEEREEEEGLHAPLIQLLYY